MSDRSPDQIAAAIDEHWDFNNPAATETIFRSLLARSDSNDDRRFLGQLKTQIARTLSLQRRFDEAHAMLDTVEAILDEQPPLTRVRYLLERGRTFNSNGKTDLARPLFLEAWNIAGTCGAEFYAIDAAHMLGIVESPAEALDWNLRALDAAGRAHDPRAAGWEGSLCNNIGWTYHGEDRFEEALGMFERALTARRAAGKQPEVQVARWCIARCQRSLGFIEEALQTQRTLLDESSDGGDGFTHEELAECLHALDRAEEASPHFALAFAKLSADPWLVENEAARIARLGKLAGG